jgi:hypothetical protein
MADMSASGEGEVIAATSFVAVPPSAVWSGVKIGDGRAASRVCVRRDGDFWRQVGPDKSRRKSRITSRKRIMSKSKSKIRTRKAAANWTR